MKKVLIVSYYFPPLNNIAAKRFGTMCKYFEENGYDAYILTTVIRGDTYLDVKADLKLPVSKDKIFRVGSNVSKVGFIEKGIILLDAFLTKCKICSVTISKDSLFWYRNVRNKIDLEKIKDIDLIVGTYGPIGNVYIAKYISQKIKCPYIVDIRDLISEWREAPEGYKRYYRLDNAVERFLLSSASGITVATRGFKRIIKRKYPKIKVMTVLNGWDGKCSGQENKLHGKYLYYAGSLYEHRLESLSLLLRCLKKVNEKEDIKLIIRSVGPKRLEYEAKKMIAEFGMQKVVDILAPATEEIIRKEQSNAYLNVILGSVHKERLEQMITVPGKTYELMNEDVPILGVTPNVSELASLLSYTDKGIATTSEEEIINFILYTKNEYVGNKNIKKFSRKYQATRFCKFMDQVLLDEK